MESSTYVEAPAKKAGVGSYIAAVLLPIVGVILAIVQFSRGNVGPGLALLLTSIVSFFIWTMILISAAASDYSSCVDSANGLQQMADC
jgi:hypothetical protein